MRVPKPFLQISRISRKKSESLHSKRRARIRQGWETALGQGDTGGGIAAKLREQDQWI